MLPAALLVLALAPPAAAQGGSGPPDPVGEPATFGEELSVYDVDVSWSAYGDATFRVTSEGDNTFDVGHVNPILRARLTDALSAEFEMEFEHGGGDILLEYAFADWHPASALRLRVGRLLVPVGRYNAEQHPSFRWVQASRPAFAEGVLPVVWSDTGVEVSGEFRLLPALHLGWVGHAGNGLGGTLDPAVPDAIRDLRDNFVDNNHDKAVGGRLTLELFPGARVGEVRLDASGWTQALDDAGGQRWEVLDLSARVLLGPVTLLSEAAVTRLDGERLAEGGYVLAQVALGAWVPAVRVDRSREPGGESAEGAVAASVLYEPMPWWNVRLELGHPVREEGAWSGALMGAFYF